MAPTPRLQSLRPASRAAARGSETRGEGARVIVANALWERIRTDDSRRGGGAFDSARAIASAASESKRGSPGPETNGRLAGR